MTDPTQDRAAMPPFGHEDDPVEDICIEVRQALPGGYHNNPCRCAELRIAYAAGIEAGTKVAAGRAIATREGRSDAS